jgi:hypothetical protein
MTEEERQIAAELFRKGVIRKALYGMGKRREMGLDDWVSFCSEHLCNAVVKYFEVKSQAPVEGFVVKHLRYKILSHRRDLQRRHTIAHSIDTTPRVSQYETMADADMRADWETLQRLTQTQHRSRKAYEAKRQLVERLKEKYG